VGGECDTSVVIRYLTTLQGTRIVYSAQFGIAGLDATTSTVDVVGRQVTAPSLHRTAAGGPCNTEKLNLTDDLYSYILSHTPEPQVRWHA
jgi:hypothetical protein